MEKLSDLFKPLIMFYHGEEKDVLTYWTIIVAHADETCFPHPTLCTEIFPTVLCQIYASS